MAYVPTLKTQYKEQIVPALMKEFGYSSVMQCPKLQKIVINQGMGQAVADKKLIDVAEAELTQITGQKAVQTRSRKDISNFKLRKGMPIGVRVTLRDTKMYEFLERLIAVALPRIRDFKGINEKFDGQGNYTLGITEQIIFPSTSRSSSRRSTSTRSRRSSAWRSPSSRRPRPTRRLTPCSATSAFLSKTQKRTDALWQKNR